MCARLCAYVTKAHRLYFHRRRDLCVCVCVTTVQIAPQIWPRVSFYLPSHDDSDDGVGGGEERGRIFFCLLPLAAKRETLPDAH